jgi:transcription elongation factor GreA
MSAQHAGETPVLTSAGRATLQQELERLCTERLPALSAQLAEAHEDAAARDEDAGLLELQVEMHRLERSAMELERLLATAQVITPLDGGVVALGSCVEIEDGSVREQYQVVQPHEADVAAGRLSLASPVGQALLGHTAGDAAVVVPPEGEHRIQILAVW